jgi:hypothetical protein
MGALSRNVGSPVYQKLIISPGTCKDPRHSRRQLYHQPRPGPLRWVVITLGQKTIQAAKAGFLTKFILIRPREPVLNTIAEILR